MLESARHIDTIVLDKTGTITEGRMAVVSVIAGAGATTAEVIKAAGSAESGSDHPIAKAIADHARTHGSLDTVTKLHATARPRRPRRVVSVGGCWGDHRR